MKGHGNLLVYRKRGNKRVNKRVQLVIVFLFILRDRIRRMRNFGRESRLDSILLMTSDEKIRKQLEVFARYYLTVEEKWSTTLPTGLTIGQWYVTKGPATYVPVTGRFATNETYQIFPWKLVKEKNKQKCRKR